MVVAVVAVAGRLAVITVVAELALMVVVVVVEVEVEVHRTKVMSSDDLEQKIE